MVKQYHLKKLPLSNLDYNNFIEILSEANRLIARYDGMLESIPNKYIFLTPLLTQEAVLSSKIEGTQATFQEVLEFDVNAKKFQNKQDDIWEIKNYRLAMGYAIKNLNSIPLCLRLIKGIHKVLMQNVRGGVRAPGEFRQIQNWIGSPGSKIEDATYIPPKPDALKDFLYNFEDYLNFNEKDFIVQAAIMHSQFEILHPFLDGNGRIGRILIPLFLYTKKVMTEPVFYISTFFEKNKDEYYMHLNEITSNNKWNDWISFFIKGVTEQSRENIRKISNIKNLFEEYKQKIFQTTKSNRSIQIIDTLFKIPVFKSSQFSKMSGIPQKTSERYLKMLIGNGVLVCDEKEKQKTYFFSELLDIMK